MHSLTVAIGPALRPGWRENGAKNESKTKLPESGLKSNKTQWKVGFKVISKGRSTYLQRIQSHLVETKGLQSKREELKNVLLTP